MRPGQISPPLVLSARTADLPIEATHPARHCHVSLVRPQLVSPDPRAGPGRSGTIEAVDVASETEHRPGQPRSERDSAFLDRFNARMQLPIIVSAILPLVV